MEISTNKDKGKTGLALAIGYYGSNGYTISLPLNDTQDYDLIVDDGKKLQKVQVKFTDSINCYGSYQVSVRSCGGTDGGIYKRVIDTDIDILFVICSNGQMFEIPKQDITQRNTISLNTNNSNVVSKYLVCFEFIKPFVNPVLVQEHLQKKKTNFCIDCGKPIDKKAKRCFECNKKHQTEEKRSYYSKCPNKEELIDKILQGFTLTEIKKFYNVAFITVKHWLQRYDLPCNAEGIKQFKENYKLNGR